MYVDSFSPSVSTLANTSMAVSDFTVAVLQNNIQLDEIQFLKRKLGSNGCDPLK